MRSRATPWLYAVAITALVAWFGAILLPKTTWGPPEQPPRAQGEALVQATDGRWIYRSDLPAQGVRETQNTWTNLAYIFAGVAIGVSGRTTASRFLGVALFFLGCGSGLYHASATDHWRLIDIVGMYWTISLLVMMGLAAALKTGAWVGKWSALVVSAVAVMTAIYRNDIRVFGLKPFDSTYVTVAGVLAVGLCLFAVSRQFRLTNVPMLSAVCLLLTCVAIVGRLGDEPGRFWFSPQGFVQGHAVWHVASAAAVVLASGIFEMAFVKTSESELQTRIAS